jgi:hypothetical protein
MATPDNRRRVANPPGKTPGPATGPEVVPPGETLLILLGVVGLIPWCYVWINVLAPKVGLRWLGFRGHVFMALALYLIPWVLLTRKRK